MRSIITWAKNSPITTGSILIVPLCFVALFFVHGSGKTLKEEMEKRVTVRKQVETYISPVMEVPSANPDDPMATARFTITDAAVRGRTRIKEDMDAEHEAIFKWVVGRNRRGEQNYLHQPMLPDLFPGPPRDEAAPLVARVEYIRVLRELTEPYSSDAQYPRLNGGRPLMYQEMAIELIQFEADYKETNLLMVNEAEPVSEADARALHNKKYEKLINRLREHAQKIHIYVNTPVAHPSRPGDFQLSGDTPFYVGPWARPDRGDKPKLAELWQAQLDLWIQQDIVEAIAITNRVDDLQMNVINAPIKRLIRIDVIPGYVGINSKGAVVGYKSESVGGQGVVAAAGGGGRFGGGMGQRGMGGAMGFGGVPLGGMGGRPGGLGMGMAPGAAGYGGMFDPSMRQLNFGAGMGTLGNEGEDAEDDASIVAKPEGKMPENFEYAPTGRRSNGLYDVRHAVVKVIIDSMRIPQFLTNLSKVNFMTVLLMTVNDVDEYEHLRGNAPSDGTGSSPRAMYIYGPHDAVELELVIETLWLRRWTAGHWDKEEADRLGEEFDKGLIPDDVRQLLGMHRRVPQGSTDERQAEDES